jgi:glycerone phosphate O-acyltransferase
MEGFNDLIEEIRKQGGQLMWITQKRQFLENVQRQQAVKGPHKPRTPDQIKQDVLQSARLRHCIDQLMGKDSSLTRDAIQLEAKKILDEMAHQFDLKYVRMLGYVLIKVFTRIYKHIYYNSDILNNLQVLKTHPTLFLPLHRSYMDFLLISIICFHKNIQLPAIATGQDFLGLAMLSEVIRRTGAFFIRRSFGSDQLYWALFNEYVQQHMLNCDRPLEFFIEGMRSRTSKSLRPKLGMFSTCLETYLKGHRVEVRS